MRGKIEAILFDLDDTLLGNDMDVFIQSYLPLLAAHARPIISADKFLPELLLATQAMIDSSDLTLTNREVFWDVFCQRNALDREEVEPFFATFYRERFGELRTKTQLRPEAAPLVRWCMDQGLKVVVATNPLFPLDAIQQRLAWGGLSVDEFDFALVTGYENMHAAKPRAAYYEEILESIDVDAEKALMVGDDWLNDIAPSHNLGLHTFWIAGPDDARPDEEIALTGQGTLADLFGDLKRGRLV